MKCHIILMLSFAVAGLGGCVNYAGIEQTRLGMTVDELLTIDTPCYYSGQSENQIRYHCSFSVPMGPQSKNRTIKPYILTFENDALSEIALDENELIRQRLREQFYYQQRLRYPHGHFRPAYPAHP